MESNFDREVKAAVLAIQRLKKEPRSSNVVLLIDSQAATQAIVSPDESTADVRLITKEMSVFIATG